jgi:hypothetical protein
MDDVQFKEDNRSPLSDQERDAFLKLLKNPPSPNAVLKQALLRHLATEAFDALDRGEGTTLEGDQSLADRIREIGQRVARNPSGE